MAGAFYPNYFIKSAAINQVGEREAVKTLGGRDPFSTVYFSGNLFFFCCKSKFNLVVCRL